MTTHVLLCSDLDRTLLPNGPQEESPEARLFLNVLAKRPEVTIVYVSGRHKSLLLEAIKEYEIPVPDFAIGDVGTTIYEINDNQWLSLDSWEQEIASDWNDISRDELQDVFDDLDWLKLQESEKQNRFKLSYYTALDIDNESLLKEMQRRLSAIEVRASLIWSVDKLNHVGLLDVLPASATKYHAIRFLMNQKGFDKQTTVFAGDSGNDMPVLTSGLQSILVRNAEEDIKAEAIQSLKRKGLEDKLYLAHGGFLGMNGNYAAGVLEGLVHFVPATKAWFA